MSPSVAKSLWSMDSTWIPFDLDMAREHDA